MGRGRRGSLKEVMAGGYCRMGGLAMESTVDVGREGRREGGKRFCTMQLLLVLSAYSSQQILQTFHSHNYINHS